MPHEIATIQGQAAMMYVGEPPWHGLGTPLNKPATSAEAIRAAYLDWKVEKVPLYIKVKAKARAIPHHFAIIRATGKEPPVFAIVGNNYTPLQNWDAFTWFDSIVGQNAAVYHTAGALYRGERIWILAKLPGEIRVAGDDISEKYLLLSNSHDATRGIQVKFTPIRVVCQNTLAIALSRGQTVSVRHTNRMEERLKLAQQNLKIINSEFEKIEQAFQHFARVPICSQELAAYLTKVFPEPSAPGDERARKAVKRHRDLCCNLFESGRGNDLPKVRGTLWAAYNGVAEAVDHHFKNRSPENRLNSIWFGNGYFIKARAFTLGLDLANTRN